MASSNTKVGKAKSRGSSLLCGLKKSKRKNGPTPSVAEGVLLGMGNPLLDISVEADAEFLTRYQLQPNNAILADEPPSLHHEMFSDLLNNPSRRNLPGGATQNSIRVAQCLLSRPYVTTFFGSVGDDAELETLKQMMEEWKVKVVYQVQAGSRTGRCGVVITGQNRENRSLVTELAAAEMFTQSHLDDNWHYVEKARYYYIGGFFIDKSGEAALRVAEHCAKENKTLVMNLHATFLVPRFIQLDFMRYVDILFGNDEEALKYAEEVSVDKDKLKPKSSTQNAEHEASLIKGIALAISASPKQNGSRGRIVVITRGEKSTIVAHDGTVEEIPVQQVPREELVDTNGCGDAFVGGFLSQLVQGRPLDQCLRCGARAAAVVIREHGCTFTNEEMVFY